MSEFKEYLKFSDMEKATEYTSVLEKHNIPFEIDDVSMRFKLTSNHNSWENQFILKIKDSDIEKTQELFETEIDKEVKNITPDHYLYTFADEDILDVIANQNEWTKSEVKLALKIANERNIELSAQSIKSAKKLPETKPKEIATNTLETAQVWFWLVGIFSIANSIFLRVNINFRLPGLKIAELFESVFLKVFGTENRIGLIVCLILSCLMFVIARYGKKNNKHVFLIGVIFYGMDTILTMTSGQWGSMLYHFLVLWITITAVVKSFKETGADS